MDNNLSWFWNLSFESSYREDLELPSGNKESLIFSTLGASYDTMRVVLGNKPLKRNTFYCWTIFIENTVNAEIMIGVASSDADFTEKWNVSSRLGMDKTSWIIASGGYLCHNARAIVNENWRFFNKDHITVYFSGDERTLGFAINGKHIGVQYLSLPVNVCLYPVVGVSRYCSLLLKRAYESPITLQLLSFLSHIYSNSANAGILPTTRPSLPSNLKLMWLKPVTLSRRGIPSCLRTIIKRHYPWFFERNIHRTRVRPRRWNSTSQQYPEKVIFPKTIRLKDQSSTFQMPSYNAILRSRIHVKTSCGCSSTTAKSRKKSTESCGHEKTLKFLRKRDLSYDSSSSDDELFINSKFRKKYGKVIITNHV